MAPPLVAALLSAMPASHELGRRGEALAAEWLRRRGWRILHRNFREGRREIDLVARRGVTIAFVEVKTRTDRSFGDPLESVTRAKRREIERVARGWAARNGRPGDCYRFDAIGVVWPANGRPRIEHVPDAWRRGG